MNELKSYRDCADVGDQFGLPKVNHSTLSKKAGHVDYNNRGSGLLRFSKLRLKIQ